ncbi:formylglycine-generating enzyme family protein [Marinobacter nitratireducens]|nr:SUMF1/EgtB/PvdO family nonheme iron enzyme [Marinobacter nitratireducens]
MPSKQTFKALALILLTIQLTACDAISDWQKIQMVQRNMDNMVFVEGGEFLMGNPGGWSVRRDTIPVHKVELGDFYIQKYEVTQEDFEVFVRASDHDIKARFYDRKRRMSPERFKSELPAPVSWHDAKAYCLWLGEQSGRDVDLPTEAQWEYAARSGGLPVQYATNNGELHPGLNINEGSTLFHAGNDQTLPSPPGSFPPNPLGLHDMSGNVGEWVNDYYAPDYYQNSVELNPQGPETGNTVKVGPNFEEPERVMRGGHYRDLSGSSTVTRRQVPEYAVPLNGGFRCVMN